MSASETWALVRAVARKTVRLRVHYAFNTLTSLVAVYLLFLLVVVAGRRVAPGVLAASLPEVVVSAAVLAVASVAAADLAWDLVREAQWGTLEQLAMSPLGFGRVVLVETAVNVGIAFGYGAVLLSLLVATTGSALRLDPVTVLPVGLLTVATAVGVGLAVGGLALAFKRIEHLFALVQFAFVAFVAAPVEQVPALKLLPLALGSHLLRLTMAGGRPLWTLPTTDLALLAVEAGAYLLVGYAGFQFAAARARRRGTLGQY
ncbi:MAG: ABC transporter permease [Haloarculaceae archaeon]